MLLNTTITVKFVDGNAAASAESLQDLMGLFVPAAEQLEEELRGLQGMDALTLDDQVVWNLELEGPKWDYLAQGSVSHLRGDTEMECRDVSIHGGKLKWRG